MFKLSSQIEFFDSPSASKAKWVSNSFCLVDINSSIQSLTDACTISIPKKIVWKDDNNIIIGNKKLLKRGNKIIIKLGYDDKLYTRFIGYIRDVVDSIPTKITLDNSMWLLKQNPINDSWESETLGGYIKRVIPQDVKTVCDDPTIKIGAFRIKNSTPAQALDKLLQTYPLYATFLLVDDEPVLHIGLAYPSYGRKEIEFKEGYNIISTENLQWRNADEVKVKIVVKVKKYVGGGETEEQYEFGDSDGEQVTFYQLNIDKTAAEKYAKAKLAQLKYTGLYGTFETFGNIPVNKGDIANITLKEGTGKYLIKSVRTEFGKYYHQTIELGGLLNAN